MKEGNGIMEFVKGIVEREKSGYEEFLEKAEVFGEGGGGYCLSGGGGP